MPDVLLYGHTEGSAAMRHEIPIAIGDPFLYVETDGRQRILTNVLEAPALRRALPEAELLFPQGFGQDDLLAAGVPRDEIALEVTVRAVVDSGITVATVPFEFPLGLADRLRAAGVELLVDDDEFQSRRRVKNAAELAGIKRAQAAGLDGLRAAAALLGRAVVAGNGVELDGRPLLAEHVRAVIREACAAAGAPAPPDIMVATAWSGGGHDSGYGPLPANLPITIDLWPRDEATGCWADMTRTFVVGEVTAEVSALAGVVRASLEASKAIVRPGAKARAAYDKAADVIEAAGYPTQRSREPGTLLDHGFYFSLGHGVGLELHESPGIGLSDPSSFVAGDVVALEPGIENLPGIGGVRFEDMLLVTDTGSETLTDFPYDLQPWAS